MSQFIKIPFLPEKKVSHVIVDGRISDIILLALKELHIDVITTPASSNLYAAVSRHPDMLIHPVGNNILVVAPDVYEFFQLVLSPLNFQLIKGKTHIKSNYPGNIAYNVARINNMAFHNMKYTDPVIRAYLDQNSVQMINVKQGYSKCSVCIVNDHAIITSDKGIANAADIHNIDVLLIQPGYISLPGLNYGFIGGATGLVSQKRLVVAGSLNRHPDVKNIVNFCNKYDVEVISLGDEDLIDIGSIIPILYE